MAPYTVFSLPVIHLINKCAVFSDIAISYVFLYGLSQYLIFPAILPSSPLHSVLFLLIFRYFTLIVVDTTLLHLLRPTGCFPGGKCCGITGHNFHWTPFSFSADSKLHLIVTLVLLRTLENFSHVHTVVTYLFGFYAFLKNILLIRRLALW